MFRLAFRMVWRRKAGFAASLIALFFGALIVTACGGLMETGIELTVPPQRLAGAPLIVTGSQSSAEEARLPDSLVQKLQNTPGVQRAVADLSFSAAVLQDNRPINDATQLPGHGWSSAQLAPYTLIAGAAPITPYDVVLDTTLVRKANLHVGDIVPIAAQGHMMSFRVAGIAANALVHAPAIFFSDMEARQLFNHPAQVDNIGIVPVHSSNLTQLQTRINAVAHSNRAEVLTGNKRGIAEFEGTGQQGAELIAISAVFGGLAIMVTSFIVSSTLSLSVQQRRREMALLKAVGATPRQVRHMVVAETIFLAIIAMAAAYWPSAHVGGWLLSQFAHSGAVSSLIIYRQGWVSGAVGVIVALLVALVTAPIAARSATRVRPTEALVEASAQRRWLTWIRLTFAILFLAGASALALVTALAMHGPSAAGTASPEVMLWAIGFALLGPGLAAGVLSLLRQPARRFFGLSGKLATLNLAIRKIRVAGIIVPVMLATGLATTLIYLQTSQSATTTHVYTHELRADDILTSSIGGMPIDTVSAVASQPGVASATALIHSTGYLDVPADVKVKNSKSVALEGVTANAFAQTTTLSVNAGSLADLQGDTVALPTDQAAKLDKKVGDDVNLRFGDGVEMRLKVVAIVKMPAGYSMVLLPVALLVQHTSSGLVSQIVVHASPGTSMAQLSATLHTFARHYPGLHITDDIDASSGQPGGVWVTYLLIGVVVIYAVISLINTLIVATTERQREFALQRLIGATRGQVLCMVCVEALLMSIAGAILGTCITALTLAPFCIALKDSPFPSGPFWIYVAIICVAVALTLLTMMLSTLAVLRAKPIDATAIRE